MNPLRRLLSAAALSGAVLVLCACTSASIVRDPESVPSARPVRSVACLPGGGVLAGEIEAALRRRGVVVLDAAATSTRLGDGVWHAQAQLSPAQAGRLEGVDAALLVRTVEGHDGSPLHATVLLQSVPDASVLARLHWRNGEGARAGSLLDRWAQVEPSRAAEQIVSALLEPPPPR